jgi:glycerol-3-phosphate dehydrogenase (NAD(P)+)
MKIAVLGAGAWGTALAVNLAARHTVCLWVRDAQQAQEMQRTRCNARYLADTQLPESIVITPDFSVAIQAVDLCIIATPMAGLRQTSLALSKSAARDCPVLWLCKGVEVGTNRLPHQVVAEVYADTPPACGALSGPSFAQEVAQGLPCALTLASHHTTFARDTAAALHGGRLRVYWSEDLTGVEIGGATKNVLAIAVGIGDGLGLGQNARAALITRGLVEIQRLGVAMGASPETLMGLTGAGDLILTATGQLSRNRRVGLALATGQPLAQVLATLGHVAEGVACAAAVQALAQQYQVEMPICQSVNAVLTGQRTPAAALDLLLARDPRAEH